LTAQGKKGLLYIVSRGVLLHTTQKEGGPRIKKKKKSIPPGGRPPAQSAKTFRTGGKLGLLATEITGRKKRGKRAAQKLLGGERGTNLPGF